MADEVLRIETDQARRAVIDVIRMQLAILCESLPPEVEGFLSSATAKELTLWGKRVAANQPPTSADRVFSERYVELNRERLQRRLEERFGALSDELWAALQVMLEWEIDSSLEKVELGATAAECVVRSAATRLRADGFLEGYRESMAELDQKRGGLRRE